MSATTRRGYGRPASGRILCESRRRSSTSASGFPRGWEYVPKCGAFHPGIGERHQHGCCLHRCCLHGCYLHGCCLHRCCLHGCYLHGCCLHRCHLHRCHLHHCHLQD
ncbi:pentapeptide repeat-containing protein, partial [Bifidobacterium sp.]|uniref:pentapeptide repeat-containing protein n=1 Tax=Bifidobacterium sp. TaxID=41200 RepID=UPI0039EAC30A